MALMLISPFFDSCDKMGLNHLVQFGTLLSVAYAHEHFNQNCDSKVSQGRA